MALGQANQFDNFEQSQETTGGILSNTKRLDNIDNNYGDLAETLPFFLKHKGKNPHNVTYVK